VGISLISPPVGGCRSVACGIGNLPMQTVVRALIPFYPVLVVTVLAIGYVPEIALFIPRLLGYLDG
jgi:TRAP-type C4-dicarboxylate transport system permease large subunit